MRKFLLLIFVIVILIIIGVILLWPRTINNKNNFKEISMEKTLTSKKVAMIIAFRDFRDEEYFIPKQVLESAGVVIQTASTQIGEAIGSQGGEAQVDIKLADLKVVDFDAIVFVGGQGAIKYLDNQTSYQIAKTAVSENKILAAICVSPSILAKAGVLSGKKATVWSSVLDKSAVKVLKENDAIFEDSAVVVDGNIVTANGPSAAEQFGEKIISLIK